MSSTTKAERDELRAGAKALQLPSAATIFLFGDVSPKEGIDPIAIANRLLNALPRLLDTIERYETALKHDASYCDCGAGTEAQEHLEVCMGYAARAALAKETP